MKKIIAILLVMVIALGALAGCSSKSVSKADLEANPQKYIEEGIKTSLSKSPFGSILELKEPEATSIDVSIAPEDKDLGYIKLNSIIANKKLGALTTLDFNVEDEKIQGKLFVDAENLAVQSEALKEYFGTDAIGVGLKDVVEKFKKSGWYELIKESGLEEEFKSEMETEGLDKINFDDIVKTYEKYLNDSQAALEECKKYTVKEATLGKTKGFEVEETISEDIITKFDDIFNTFAKDLAKAIGVDAEELGIEAMPDEIKDELKDIIKSYYTTYFIAKKTGAILEVKTSLNIEVEDEEAYYFAKINFGENPTKMFQPTFEAEINNGSETISIKGESTIDVKAKSFAMDIKLSTVEESANIKLTIDKDSNFKLEATDGDETVQIEGIFKVENSKLQLSFDTSKMKDIEDVNIDINIDFNAKAPSGFKYDDLLEYDKKKVEDLIAKFNDIMYN